MNFPPHNKVDFSLQIKPLRKANRSEGFTAVDIYRNDLPLNLLHKKLTTSYRWSAGRSKKGRSILRTGGRLSIKSRKYNINYNFRDERLSLIAGFLFTSVRARLFSLVFLSSGSVTYTPTSENHELFKLTRFKGLFFKDKGLITDLLNKILPISQVFFLIAQLPKNRPVCLLESKPGKGVQYVRASGAKATLIKMDSRISTSVVRLPSGVRKVFSTYGLGSLGSVALSFNNKMENNKAGRMYGKGRKPTVRGVAMNPVDHPHGGRAKAIAHQRTPWGKSTKRK